MEFIECLLYALMSLTKNTILIISPVADQNPVNLCAAQVLMDDYYYGCIKELKKVG